MIHYTSKLIIIISIIITILVISISSYFLYDNYNGEHFNVSDKKYKLGIVSIFKNEQDYMQEWLDFHIAQGFEQFYLYSNDPDLTKYPYLNSNKYIGYIKIIDWVQKQNDGINTIQRQAYSDCVKKYNNECQFMLLLDLDEFVHPYKNFNTVIDYIISLKDNWKEIVAFKIQRFNFGSNGHLFKPEIPVSVAYTKHEKICSSYKTLANTNYIDSAKKFYGVHDFPYKNINNKLKIFNAYLNYNTGFPSGCNLNNKNEIPLVINHYYTKSYEEYLQRAKLWENGGINPIKHRKDHEMKFHLFDHNDTEKFE